MESKIMNLSRLPMVIVNIVKWNTTKINEMCYDDKQMTQELIDNFSQRSYSKIIMSPLQVQVNVSLASRLVLPKMTLKFE
jgi:hypothetical protein